VHRFSADGTQNTTPAQIPVRCVQARQSLKLSFIITTRQILIFIVAGLLLSCNANKTIDNNVLTNINRYEQSAKEIVSSFETLIASKSSDKTFSAVVTLYSNDFRQGESITENSNYRLPLTKKLCADSLTKLILLEQDTTVCYNTMNSETSLAKFYRHFLCFSPNDKEIHLELSHAYKTISTKKVKPGWTYIIVEQCFD